MAYARLKPATTSADLVLPIRIRDRVTKELVDLVGSTITVAVQARDRGGAVLSASTADGRVTMPELGVFVIRFPKAALSVLRPGTYDIGCTIERDGDTRQLFVGQLPLQNGVVL